MGFLTRIRFSTLLIALAMALVPASAFAKGEDVIRDCAQDGDLDRDYSDQELQDAYNNLPSDIDEYSNCRDVIRQAQAGGRGSADGKDDNGGGGGAAGGSGGSSGDNGYRNSVTGDNDISGKGGTPSDNSELQKRTDRADSPPLTADQAASKDDDSGLPTAVLVALILLALAAVAGGLYLVRDRLPASLTSRLPGMGPGQSR